MSNDNSWIDDVIKKHRKELKELQNSKNTIEDSHAINYSQNFHTVNVNQCSYEHHTITADLPSKNEDDILQTKLIKKKEKIIRLKNEIEQLKKENEELKKNANNSEEEQYKSIIIELNNKISLLTNENSIKEKRIYQLESLKNQEIEKMNRKIKDFEVIIDENANNYINERKGLTEKIEEYQNKLNKTGRYIEMINTFINKIDTIFNVESKNVYDINELQQKLSELENFILKQTTNNSVNNIEDNLLNDNSLSNNLEQNNIMNTNTNLKMPHFQNKYLEEGFASNTNNDSFQEGFENNNNTSDLKTLEERICKIETELKKKKTKPAISHIRRKNSGTKNLEMKLTTNVKNIRSKSSNKIPKPETKKVKKAKKVNNSYKADNDNSKTDSNQMSIISNLNHNAYSSATTKRNKPQTAKSKKK